MRITRFTLAILLLSGSSGIVPADDPPKAGQTPSADEIQRIVNQLGDEAFVKRAQAKKALEEIGEPAVDALKKAAESAGDEEIRTAARALVAAIEVKASGVVRILPGHGNRVNGVAVTADGTRALSASWDGTLRYWNLETGDLIHQMRSTGNMLMSAALSPDGKRGLTGSGDRTMCLWDLETGRLVRTFAGHTNQVWDVAFSPDGKTALSGSDDGTSRLWDLSAGRPLRVFETIKGGRAWTVAFTPDGKQAVTGGGTLLNNRNAPEAALRLWDLTTGAEVSQFRGHTKDVRRVAVSPDGKRLLSASFDGTMRLWDLQTGQELQRFDGPGNFVEAVAFTPDGKRAICCYGSRNAETIYEEDPSCSLRLWDLATGKVLKQFRGHGAPILSLAISGDGRFLVSGSADNTMRVWRMPK